MNERLRGGRPENAMDYQQPTRAELYAEIRRLDGQLQQAVGRLRNLADWGWGEYAPDDAIRDWKETRAWLAAHHPSGGRLHSGRSDA
jgi:hypothetical protein